MSRIQKRFENLKSAGKTALIPFITAGDPNPEVTVPVMHAMVEAGADIIELGVPFSDPMADGPTIQKASERALEHHVSLSSVMEMVKTFRETDSETPVVLMGYLNPIEVMGYENFAERASSAGVDGILTVDLPPEEAVDVIPVFKKHNLDPTFLISPTTDKQRIEKIAAQASGWLYYVSVKGITGSAELDTVEVAKRVDTIRGITSLPIGVGFGIKDGDSAARVAKIADAVVVGSALVNRIADNRLSPEKLPQIAADFVAELRQAIDQV
ncbi:MAG: tryptophan synthase subunit alpha [Gammaproteobacteria bacterium]|nr:tryptophan synthase subunit alpha [Gammaproteobacteria bacterium]